MGSSYPDKAAASGPFPDRLTGAAVVSEEENQ